MLPVMLAQATAPSTKVKIAAGRNLNGKRIDNPHLKHSFRHYSAVAVKRDFSTDKCREDVAKVLPFWSSLPLEEATRGTGVHRNPRIQKQHRNH
jgi:hypothetical protein